MQNNSFDYGFSNLNNSRYEFHDVTKYVWLEWDDALDYTLNIVGGDAPEEFRADLIINASTFAVGQKKSTTLGWYDADTSIETSVWGTFDSTSGSFGPYWYNESHAVVVFIDALQETYMKRTTDGGATWTDKTNVGGGWVVDLTCM